MRLKKISDQVMKICGADFVLYSVNHKTTYYIVQKLEKNWVELSSLKIWGWKWLTSLSKIRKFSPKILQLSSTHGKICFPLVGTSSTITMYVLWCLGYVTYVSYWIKYRYRVALAATNSSFELHFDHLGFLKCQI